MPVTNAQVLESIGQLGSAIDHLAHRSDKNHNVEERVLVLETDISRLDRSITELTVLVKDQGAETARFLRATEEARQKDREDFFNRLEMSSSKSKPDWQVVLGAITILMLFAAALWGLAIAPINENMTRQRTDLEATTKLIDHLSEKFYAHEKLPFHPAAQIEFGRMRDDHKKLAEDIRDVKRDLIHHILEVSSKLKMDNVPKSLTQ